MGSMLLRPIYAFQKNKLINAQIKDDKKTTTINYSANNHGTRNYSYSITTIMNYLVTGLICSGKSTFLDIARKHNFEVIKSDDIVASLYNEPSTVEKIKHYLNINISHNNLKDYVKEFFFKSKKNREIIEAIFHPTVHEIILNEFQSKSNLMVEVPPIINNYGLFKEYSSIYIDTKEEMRIERFSKHKINDKDYFIKMNAIQNEYELIKDSCEIIINNNNDIDSLGRYFDRTIIAS